MKQISLIALSILLFCSVAACGQKELYGVFSNEAEGFKIATFMVHESGYAYFNASGVASVIGQWSYDKTSTTLTFDYFDSGPNKDSSIKFKFDSEKRSYSFIGDETEGNADSSRTLHYITNTIPDQLIQAFKTYPVELERRRRQIQAQEKEKREYEEKLAREKPEYERIRKSILENPRVVVSEEFYVREDTPATRALKSTLRDREVEFPENVLIDLLKELPPDNHWIREMLFSRPELTAGTIETFYPQALDWGARLNYGILVNIANHPNTPRQLIEDLALRKELPIGATQPAQRQMVKYTRELLAGSSETSPETFGHLYEFALQVPKTNTDSGKTIILELARSIKTPTSILGKIAETDDQLVQRAIISNTNTPLGTLNQLSGSRFPKVRADVVSNARIPVETLLALSKDHEGRVRAAVAAHPATPVTTLTEMQSDEYFDVRRNLIRNPNTPTSVLEKLAADKYAIIKSEARMALREREVQN